MMGCDGFAYFSSFHYKVQVYYIEEQENKGKT